MHTWTYDDVRHLPADGSFLISRDDFRLIGGVLDAFWQHEGPPETAPYHAIMVSGLHTNGFVNVSTYMAETNLAQILGIMMSGLVYGDADVAVGPGNAAITISYEVARQLGLRHGFTEKDDQGKTTKIGARMQIRPREKVVIVNELMSTPDGSTLQTKQGVLKHQPEAVVLPDAVVLVNRSGVNELTDGTWVRSVYKFAMPTWPPDQCPYCKAGSQAIKPKITRENWLKLTGKVA